MTYVLLAAIVFLAALQQTITGFAFTLLTMPVFSLMLGLPVAAPLVALEGVTLYTVNLLRNYRGVDIREAWRMWLAAGIGVPLGVWALVNVDGHIVKLVLSLLLIAYAVYSLVKPAGRQLKSPQWGYLAGLASGILGGAYNTSGPPVVLYGSMRQWPKDKFRAILQVNFLFAGALTVAAHIIGGRITPAVLTFFAVAVPALLLGVLVGSRLDGRVDKERFRRLITAMILLLGITTLLEGLH